MSFAFKKARLGPILSGDERARQGEVVKSALTALGNADARAFLNDYHPGLCGRPLDLAIASEAGLKAVAAALRAEPRPAREGRSRQRGE